jgi:hypothetical protein
MRFNRSHFHFGTKLPDRDVYSTVATGAQPDITRTAKLDRECPSEDLRDQARARFQAVAIEGISRQANYPRYGASKMQVRPADADEIDVLARFWCDGWHETHAPLSPPELFVSAPLRAFAIGFRPHFQISTLSARSARLSASAPSRVRSCISFSCRPRRTARASLRR